MLRRLPLMPDVRSLPLLEQLDLLRQSSAELARRITALEKGPVGVFIEPAARAIVNPGDRPILRRVEVTPDFPSGADTPGRYRLHLEFLSPGRPVIEAYHIEIPFRRGSETHEVLVQLNSLGIEVEKFHRQLIAGQTLPIPMPPHAGASEV